MSRINPLLASFFNLRRHRAGIRPRVLVVIDPESGVAVPDYLRCLEQWRTWIATPEVVERSASEWDAIASSPGFRDATVIALVTDHVERRDRMRTTAEAAGKTIVDTKLPPENSREFALFQEVLHHDFVLGGRNDWTGEDSMFAPPTLRALSRANCRETYPRYVSSHLAHMRAAKGGAALTAIDVGCGSISRLRWGALNGELTVTGADPLLDMYAVVRERHGLNDLPAIRCMTEIVCGAEDLTRHTEPESFDFAFCANALDHVEDPVAVVHSMATVLRPGGICAIQVYTREGSREGWWQLHKFDMYATPEGQFVCETQDGTVRPLIGPRGPLRVKEYVANNPEHTWVVAERPTQE